MGSVVPNNREFKEEVEMFLEKYKGDYKMAALAVHATYRSLGIDTADRLADYVQKYHWEHGVDEAIARADEIIKRQDDIKYGRVPA